MKKKILLMAALIAGFGAVNAQEGLQLGLRAGYSFPTTGSAPGADISATEQTVITGTLGSAIPVTLEGRYMFNENVGVQLDATYSIGVFKDFYLQDANTGQEVKTKAKSDQFRLAPQLVLKANSLYTRLGFVLPLAGSTTI